MEHKTLFCGAPKWTCMGISLCTMLLGYEGKAVFSLCLEKVCVTTKKQVSCCDGQDWNRCYEFKQDVKGSVFMLMGGNGLKHG